MQAVQFSTDYVMPWLTILKTILAKTTRSCEISSGPQFETGMKKAFLWYTARVRPLYPSCPCAGPFPNLLWVHVVCCPLSHCLHFSVSISPILRNHTFVGIMSWVTMYHADLAPSGKITLWRLLHTSDQSTAGWSCTMHPSRLSSPH